jgi:hypothetical protein
MATRMKRSRGGKEKPAVGTGGIDDSGGVALNALYQTPTGIEPRRHR